MLYTIFTSIVFISEIIIALALVIFLLRIDMCFVNVNKQVDILNPKLKEICDISKAISVQLKELSKIFVENIKKKQDDLLTQSLVKMLGTLILLKINSKFIKKLIRSKSFKVASSTFRLVINML